MNFKSPKEKQFILNLLYYFQQEKLNNGPLIPLAAVRERVANALQIGMSAVTKVTAAAKRNEPIAPPKKTKNRMKKITNIDSFEISAIRNIIHDIYSKKLPINIKNLLEITTEENIFNGSATSLRKILCDIGFAWKQIDNKKTLYEHPEIIISRVNFLYAFVKNMKSENPHECVYLDESCIFEKTASKNVKNEIILDGKKYIIIHADSSVVPVIKTQKPDSHAKADPKKLTKLMEDFLKILKTPSFLIINDVPCFNVKIETNPKSDWTKPQIQEWLTFRNIPFDHSMFKWQLLDIASRNEDHEKYLMDDLAERSGHQVLRLPRFHCTFNPIENAWSIAKVFRKQATKIEALQTITSDMWENCMDHAIKEINRWYERELLLDQEDSNTFMCIGDNDMDTTDSESEEN